MRGFSLTEAIFFTALLFAVFARCSVKEDRSPCPCMLVLDLSGCGRDTLGLRLIASGETVLSDTITGQFSYKAAVPRGPLEVILTAGTDVGGRIVQAPDGSLEIPYGEGCPHLWISRGSIIAQGEAVYHSPSLHKEFCNITMNVHNLPSAPSVLPTVRLHGNVKGYDPDLRPVEGPFSVDIATAGGVCQAAVPRQEDGSLMLDIVSEGVVRSFAVGELILADGYDWGAADLADITVFIDYATPVLSLVVTPYKQGSPVEIIL